jgi:hypothetical protein
MGREIEMAEKRLDALIDAGWDVLESDFDERVFLRWRKQAYECVSQLVGKDHPYAERLKAKIFSAEPSTALADVGILTAARLWRFQDFAPCSQTEKLDRQNRGRLFDTHAAMNSNDLARLKLKKVNIPATSAG